MTDNSKTPPPLPSMPNTQPFNQPQNPKKFAWKTGLIVAGIVAMILVLLLIGLGIIGMMFLSQFKACGGG